MVSLTQISRFPRKSGNPERLAEYFAVFIQERHRAVLALVDDGRVGRANQGGVHILGTGDEEVSDDLGGDGINCLSGLCHDFSSPSA